jgi:stearoyl-CoA desaturase (delta-9 desaturase)
MSFAPPAIAALTVAAFGVALLRSHLPPRVLRLGLAIAVVTPLVGTVYAMWLLWDRWIGWVELSLFLTLAFIPGLGVTIGYHRLLSHRSFETVPAVKLILLVLGAMSLPSRPLDFVANHLKHHAHSDREGDPHSPLEGLLHAHVGWLIADTHADRDRYCRRYADDRVVGFVDRTALIWFGVGLAIPLLIAGWEGFIWGGLVRVAFSNHVTFAVNSICHTYGSQPFATGDESRNNLLLGLLAAGEGWHNNHHAFPSAASHGMGWRQPDLSGLVIKALALTGLAWNVKGPAPELVERRRNHREPDGTSAA